MQVSTPGRSHRGSWKSACQFLEDWDIPPHQAMQFVRDAREGIPAEKRFSGHLFTLRKLSDRVFEVEVTG